MVRDELKRRVFATTPLVSKRMSAQSSWNTAPERVLRSALHALGLRFRIHQKPLAGLRREADIVFPRAKVAVFVDGCFWHGCPEHGAWPATNPEYWRAKIEGNAQRDQRTDMALSEAGWLPVRVWEHERVDAAAERVERLVRGRLTQD